MKASILFFTTAALLISCSPQKKELTTITGQLQNAANINIYFEKITADGDIPVDSATTDGDGNFTLINRADELDYYLLRTGNQSVAYLILKGGETLTIKGDANNMEQTYEVKGSEDTRVLLQLKRFDTHLSDSMNRIYSAFREENPFQKDSVGALLQQQYLSTMRDFAINLIRQNFSSMVSLSATKYLDKQKDFSLFVMLNDSLHQALGDNRYVNVFSKQVEDMKRLPVGSMAPEIKLPSPEGKEIALSSLKGKVVVIDFWASWCGPCRREMPEMIELYKNFKNLGLEIYGVSLDDNIDAWKTAIASDHITWIQVSELKKWDSKVALEYGIEEIPQTILIDREGKIVAKGLPFGELQVKLQEVLRM
ncbi:MAG: TlpA disulfide reductase family protein [Bacteroidetes bacterium]|nr:TlpA disulfide reductase family protein [Bacteroidota bacterium]